MMCAGVAAYASNGAVAKAGAEKPFTIGVSNGFIGSPWRTQMLNDMQLVNKEYQAKGLTKRLLVQSATVDINGQIRQIQTLMNQGVDAILVDTNSANALNPILDQAVARGIVVVAFDNITTNPKVVNVAISQKQRGTAGGAWVASQMGGKGNMVIVGGVAGAPANDLRNLAVAKLVKAKYPKVKITQTLYGKWDLTTGNQVMSTYLASNPKVNGVFTQDGGQAQGVLKALVDSGIKPLPAINGEPIVGWVKYAAKVKKSHPEFKPFTDFNLPQQGAIGLRIAVNLLQGKKLKPSVGNTVIVPLPAPITPKNFSKWVAASKGKPNAFTLEPAPLSQAAVDKAWFTHK